MKLFSKTGKRDTTQQTPVEIEYPETEWSDEQKRALQMATTPSAQNTAPISNEAVDQSFEHLAPPKKSIGKILLIVLLITVLVAAAAFGGWYYWWTTHATFDYELQPVVILNGQGVTPNEFLTDASISDGISAIFQNPEFTPVQGRVSVPLILDLGWRSLEATATLYVMVPLAQTTHEFRLEAPEINPVDLLSNAEIARGIFFEVDFVHKPFPLDTYDVGEYTLQLVLNDAPFEVLLVIEDTTPPSATSVSVVTNIGEPVEPGDFVTDVYDASGIASIMFANEPDVLLHREQLIEVIITDTFGNFATFTSSMTVILNDSPPIFDGVDIIESMVGQVVDYGAGVTVVDSFGRTLEFEVDDSEVDISKEGEYKASYIAHDLTGNMTSVPFTVLIISVDPADVLKQADDILESILEEDMSSTDKIRAIFTHIRGLVTLAESDDKPASIFEAAHQALTAKRGNSYNFSALAQVLLTRAEIPNMRIFRSSDHPAHVWNLVNPYDDSWYHFDSMPTKVREINDLMFMFTQKQADEFSEKLADRNAPAIYFSFDPEIYPDIVKE
ncbi:MAG: transglutaminase-like domain-containing protein [Oscillospiraceae bacterium]|nr:transglutaminase-like domain-containing protein [Oscillospiraceae bacterium]